jgi:hypothetical protein
MGEDIYPPTLEPLVLRVTPELGGSEIKFAASPTQRQSPGSLKRSRTIKSPEKHERKRLQVKTVPTKSERAKIIKLVDKTSNLRAVTASPSPDWSVKRRLEYIAWARDVVAGLRGANAWLEEQFD